MFLVYSSIHINNKIKGISLAGWYCIHVGKMEKKYLQAYQMDSMIIKISTNIKQIRTRARDSTENHCRKISFGWHKLLISYALEQQPPNLSHELHLSIGSLEMQNENGNKMKMKWTGGSASQSFQAFLVNWAAFKKLVGHSRASDGIPIFNSGGVS